MKCPRCHREVDPHDQYCSHCGAPLHPNKQPQVKKRPPSIVYRIPLILLLAACLILPFAYRNLYYRLSQSGSSLVSDQKEIGEVNTNGSQAVTYDFDSDQDFRNYFSNADTFLSPIDDYLKGLKTSYQFDFTTKYRIQVLWNQDVVIRLTSTATISDHEKFIVTRMYNRTKELDEIKELYQRDEAKTFVEMTCVDQKDFLVKIMGSERYEAMVKAFAQKQEVIESGKSLGHYGQGVYLENLAKQIVSDETTGVRFYEGTVSQVVTRGDQDGEYRVRITHTYDGDGSLAR